jgi:hypothetical protein
MATRDECLVTAIVVLRDSDDRVARYVEEVHAVLGRTYADFEVLIVTDISFHPQGRLLSLLSRLECVRMVRLSRRVSDDVALTAGLELSIGDYVVVLTPLRTPSQVIPDLVRRARAGTHIVLGVPVGEKVVDGWLYRFCQSTFRRMSLYMFGTDLPGLNADTMVFSRKAVHALTHIKQKRRHLAVLLPEMGFPWEVATYEPMTEGAGVIRRPLLRSIRSGLSVMIEGSTLPLRLVGVTGLVGSLLSIAYAGYVLVINLIRHDVVEGWTTLSLQISGLLFLVFVMLTLLGEYMVRILAEASDRPLYHIADERTSSVMVRNADRLNVYHRSVPDAGSADQNIRSSVVGETNEDRSVG